MGYTPEYETNEVSSKDILRYFFESTGIRDIVKAIEYRCIADTNKYSIFNLGFGDYDPESDLIMDKTNSNNGDIYPVFHTVLNSVPRFFDKYPHDAIFVQGSDSSHEYFNECIETCRKGCVSACKNANRRIKTYRYFINKNFEILNNSYNFYGRINKNPTFTPYTVGMDYEAILVFKR